MPIRASNIVVIYFVLGALAFGGGAVTWDDSGPTQYFIDVGPDGVQPDSNTQEEVSGISQTITSLIGSFGGPVILVWNLFAGLVSFMHWPLFTFMDANAPIRVTILIGGTLTTMFYMAIIRLVKSSA